MMTDDEQKSEATPLLSSSDEAILNRVSASWMIFLFGAFFLAIGGVFTNNAVWTLSLGVILGTLVALWKLRPSRELTAVGALALVLSLIISFPSSPSVFSGRDQGSYAEAAIRLAHDGALRSHTPLAAEDFFHIYGEGKAFNVPGFFFASDGSLVTQFPLGIIVWFGAAVSLFGIAGLSIANAFTLFYSLMLVFLVLRRFLPLAFSVGGVLLAACSFPLVWIQGNTLSENLALPLFLLLSFYTISFLKKPTRVSWFLMASSAIFLCLTRIEGAVMLPVILFLLLARQSSRAYMKESFFSIVLPTGITSGCILIADILANTPFYRTVGKALVETLDPFKLHASSSSISFFSSFFRLGEIFWLYGMISLFSVALLGGIVLFKKRRFLELTPFFIALPTFFYFLSPSISSDHPWMLRRFVFSIWPTAILLAVFALAHFQQVFRKHFQENTFFRPAWFSAFCCLLLALPSFPATLPILFFSENKNLLADVETLSGSFSDRDIVLVDRMSSGDPFSLIADPMGTLFGKNAIYFFNPNDLNKLDFSRYDHVYLIAQNGDEVPYRETLGDRFEFQSVRPYTLRTSILSRETDPTRLFAQKDRLVTGSVFLIVRK